MGCGIDPYESGNRDGWIIWEGAFAGVGGNNFFGGGDGSGEIVTVEALLDSMGNAGGSCCKVCGARL